ncbi:hypothetical protein CAOG_00459 [Capsaspora owczarzaki ATCC 30864]|uniref:Uncharacterized protein n=1 Tax=Capsaspora owczarzaki (strain ATCC 30864) TaxID=595528 RepID=A0A0D2U0X3_CAPO3|nr:hypothetical protein CAOG_00459 [Capsaspora owczarzaki ATCC 30864]KJE88886.1 hypothetical protein CAOG_000459 [Capsaspora owczarzaki ATCC 30864]|eukprot:XP_004365330.2 hypothetical protein CAOG_00459 [Capsaspora owczarzaki ATCC 30864]
MADLTIASSAATSSDPAATSAATALTTTDAAAAGAVAAPPSSSSSSAASSASSEPAPPQSDASASASAATPAAPAARPNTMTISIDEFAMMQHELVSLKTAKYEFAEKEKRYIGQLAQLEELQQIKDKKVKVADILAEKTQLKKRLDTLTDDFRNMDTELKKLRPESKANKTKLDETLAALTREQQAHTQAADKLSKLETTHAATAKQAATLQSALEQERLEKRALMAGSGTQATAALVDGAASSADAPSGDSTAAASAPSAAGNADGSTASGGAVAELVREMEQLRKSLEEARAAKDGLQADLDARQTEYAAAQALSKTSSQASETELAALRATNEKQQKELAELREAKESLETSEGELVAQTMRLSERVAGLDDKCATSVAECQTLTKTVADLTASLKQKTDEHEAATTQVKWMQTRLQSEVEAHDQVKQNLAKSEKKLAESKEETAAVRATYTSTLQSLQQTEKTKQQELEQRDREVSEHKAKLERGQTESDLLWGRIKDATTLAETNAQQLAQAQQTNTSMQQQLEQERETVTMLLDNKKLLEERVNTLELVQATKFELDSKLLDANAKIQGLEGTISTLEQNLTTANATIVALETDKQALTETVSTMTEEAATTAATLQEVTGTRDRLQATLEERDAKISDLEEQVSQLTATHAELQQAYATAVHDHETAITSSNEQIQELTTKLADGEVDKQILHRKMAMQAKDFAKQLKIAQKRAADLDNPTAPHSPYSGSSLGRQSSFSSMSRTSEFTSSVPATPSHHHPGLHDGYNGGSQRTSMLIEEDSVPPSPSHNGRPGSMVIDDNTSEMSVLEEDNKLLLQRVVDLQKRLDRREEKVSFLEDHAKALTDQVAQKTKILQHYFAREDMGTLTPEKFDYDREQRSKSKGMMASMFGSKQQDSTITLSLCLEMNKRFQSLLEDMTLKNIRLQESMDTMGAEVARLQGLLGVGDEPRTPDYATRRFPAEVVLETASAPSTPARHPANEIPAQSLTDSASVLTVTDAARVPSSREHPHVDVSHPDSVEIVLTTATPLADAPVDLSLAAPAADDNASVPVADLAPEQASVPVADLAPEQDSAQEPAAVEPAVAEQAPVEQAPVEPAAVEPAAVEPAAAAPEPAAAAEQPAPVEAPALESSPAEDQPIQQADAPEIAPDSTIAAEPLPEQASDEAQPDANPVTDAAAESAPLPDAVPAEETTPDVPSQDEASEDSLL